MSKFSVHDMHANTEHIFKIYSLSVLVVTSLISLTTLDNNLSSGPGNKLQAAQYKCNIEVKDSDSHRQTVGV